MALVSNRSRVAQEIAKEAISELDRGREMERIEDRDYYTHAFVVLARVYERVTGTPGTEAEMRVAAAG